MARDINLDNVPTDLDGLRLFVIGAQRDFDAHDHDGNNSKSFLTLLAETVSARVIQIRKTSFTDTVSGMWMGLVGNTMKFVLGNASNSISWDGSTLTITGTFSGSVINGGSINIPDTVTTSSFHVDSSGNTWWGSTLLSTAVGKILATGAATFTTLTIGNSGFQYTFTDQGMYTFGDGSDGNVTLDGSTDYATFSSRAGANYTLTRDVSAISLTINNNIFLYPAGYRIFCQNTLTVSSGGQINVDGNAAVTTTPGAATATGYLPGGTAGGAAGGGGIEGNTSAGGAGNNGSAPTAIVNSVSTQGGTAGANSQIGGAAGAFAGGAAATGGVAGTKTLRNINPVLLWNFMSWFDVNADSTLAKYTSSVPGSGGAGGGGGAAGSANNGVNSQPGAGGGGGAGGGSAGIMFIAARALVIAAGGNLYARGGAGGAGTNGVNAVNHTNATAVGGGGGGGGGSGGAGGIVFLIYNTLSNLGSITVTGGAGGAGGSGGSGLNGGGSGSTGSTASSGASGETIQRNMAL